MEKSSDMDTDTEGSHREDGKDMERDSKDFSNPPHEWCWVSQSVPLWPPQQTRLCPPVEQL